MLIMSRMKVSIWDRPDRIPEIYGTLVALGLIVYFFLMYAVGLVHVIELRLLNVFILFAGIWFAYKQYKRTHDGRLQYFQGMSIGVATSTIGVSTFAAFLLIYLKIDQNLMNSIIENEPMGHYLNEYIAAAAVTTEGVFSGLAMTYGILNWVSTDKATSPG